MEFTLYHPFWLIEMPLDLLQSALTELFMPIDHSIHANTIGEWPAKNILAVVLDKYAQGRFGYVMFCFFLL